MKNNFFLEQIILENDRRLKALRAPYDPLSGKGSRCIPRFPVIVDHFGVMRLPVTFIHSEPYKQFIRQHSRLSFPFPHELTLERFKHDFEFWAFHCITIRDKGQGRDIPFKLNNPQRRLLTVLESMRLNNLPIRVILLKARQWGGSTLIEIYMLWIQLIHKQLWDSVICGMTLQHSQNMLAIVRKALDRYSPPDPNSDPGAPPKPHRNPDLYLKPLESSPHNKCIPARSSSLYLASSASPNSIRSADIAMAHLTEVALWPSSKSRDPQHVVQAISGSIPEIPYSFLAIESTANGTGNYFHQTWQQAVDGLNNLHPVFIEWFASELYHKDLTVSTQDFVASFSVREQQLWDLGATLQAINWYRHKASSPGMAPKQIQSEYPSSPDEAFQSSGNRVFHPDHVLQCRQDCLRPFWRGDLIAPAPSGPNALVDLSLLETRDPDIPDHNLLLIWNMPSLPHLAFRNRYIITVDIGGPDPHNDPTNILVLDRNDLRFNPRNGKTAVVAEWHGHIPLDLVAWKAAQIAQFYHCGLLVIESNSADAASTRGNHFESILDEIARYYTNLYFRTSPVHLRSGHPKRWGFHTNSSTKPLIINHLAKILRNNAYIERNSLAADEFDSFELKDNGARMEARQGLHDDRVITRAIATYVAHSWPLPPIPKKKPLQLIPSPFSSLSPRSSLFRPSSFRHPIPRARSPAFL